MYVKEQRAHYIADLTHTSHVYIDDEDTLVHYSLLNQDRQRVAQLSS